MILLRVRVSSAALAPPATRSPAAQPETLSRRSQLLARPYLLLRFSALDSLAHCSLVQCNFTDAALQVDAASQLQLRFPLLLAAQRPWALHLQGVYAHSVSDFGVAASRFLEAEQLCASAPHEASLRSLCCAQRALSLLCGGAPGCAGAAADALAAASAPPVPCFAAQAAIMFSSALFAIHRGSPTEAKALLSRCLKAGHAELNNHELVGQVLAALGALVLQQGDCVQAKDMLMSSFTLGKAAGDLQAQAVSLSLLSSVHGLSGSASEAKAMESYAARKLGQRRNALELAKATEEHGRSIAAL